MKIKNIALTLAVAGVSLTSCSDFLDTTPDTRVYLQNAEQLRQLMVDGYTSNSYANLCELSTDNIVDNNSPGTDGTIYNRASYDIADDQIFAWEDVDLSSGSDTPSGIWSGCYGAIASVNAVLEKANKWIADGVYDDGSAISSTDMEKLRAVKGEALLSRAYHHWLLTNIFCMPWRGEAQSAQEVGLPYITAPETTVKPHYERPSLLETYQMIEADLLEGLELVNDEIYKVPKYHFNKQAAHAFAARFFLYKRDYPKVVEYATAAFKGNDPASMMNDIWDQTDFYYISDMGRYATSIERPGNWLIFPTYTQFWRRFVSSGRYACNRDAMRATIQGPGPSWYRCQYRNSRNITFAMHPAFNGMCGSAGGSEYGAYYAGNAFEQFEYTDKIAGIGYTHGVRAEFTAEETLLARAEAYVFMGEIELAFQDLKTFNDGMMTENVRTKDSRVTELTPESIESFYTAGGYVYNNDTTGYGIMKEFHIDEVCPSEYKVSEANMPYLHCVEHFRRINLIHTGQRWFDIKRYGFEITHNQGRRASYTLRVLDPRWAIQVPNEVLTAGFEANKREKMSSMPESRAISSSEYVKVD